MRRISFKNHSKDYLVILIFFTLCFFLYFKSLSVPFVFDDYHMIVRNTFIKYLHKIPEFFTSGYVTPVAIPKGMYRPLLMVSFTFNYFFGKLNPLGYHIINIMFHFLNTTLLFLLLRFLLNKCSFWPAFFATLLFVAHPINSEAVIYISCRSTLMSSFFFLFGTLTHIKSNLLLYSRDKKYYLTLTAFILGLLTKETMIVFPLILISYDFLFRKKQFKNVYSFIRPYLLFILVALLYLYLRQHLFGTVANVKQIRGTYENLLTQLHVSVFYFRLFFFPWNLCLGRFFPVSHSVLIPAVMQSILIILGLFIIAICYYRKLPILTFAILWYFLNLIPKFIAKLILLAAEHQLYLPAIGIFMVSALFFEKLNYSLSKNKLPLVKNTLIALFVIIFLVLSVLTSRRNTVWQDEYSLWINNIKHSPFAWGAYNDLALIAFQQGKLDEAKDYFDQALAGVKTIPVKGLEANLYTNLATIYITEGKLELAEDALMRAMVINPNAAQIHNNLGIVFSKRGIRKKEIEEFKRAIELDPSLAEAYLNLGIAYWNTKQYTLALETIKQAINVNPDFIKPYLVLCKFYRELGNYRECIKYRLKVIDLSEADSQDYYDLGILYGYIGDRKAVGAFKMAIKLKPDFSAAHNNLAITYANLNPPQIELARKHAKLALKYGYKVRPEILKQLGMEER